jgi:hypothetical protein
VHVVRSGFNEGAGEGGWDEESARSFAVAARRFERILPKNASVTLSLDVNDDDTALALRIGNKRETATLAGPVDFDQALGWVARRFAIQRIPAVKQVPLYTLQLFASRSRSAAARAAASFELRGARAENQFFYQACLPCAIPETRVLGPSRDGLYRVVAGIYDRRAVARYELGALRRKWKLAGFVRKP